jgi:hypothetical protein
MNMLLAGCQFCGPNFVNKSYGLVFSLQLLVWLIVDTIGSWFICWFYSLVLTWDCFPHFTIHKFSDHRDKQVFPSMVLISRYNYLYRLEYSFFELGQNEQAALNWKRKFYTAFIFTLSEAALASQCVLQVTSNCCYNYLLLICHTPSGVWLVVSISFVNIIECFLGIVHTWTRFLWLWSSL